MSSAKKHPLWGWVSTIIYVSIFLLLSSFIIIGANGYRFNFQTRTFQQTGIISLTVKPEKVLVSLDGQPLEQDRSPIKLSYLLPGRHVVRLEKTGYIPWAKTIHVASGEAVIYPFVRLFLADAKPQLATQAQVALLENRAAELPDSDMDIRGNEIWVKPISRTYPIKVVGDTYVLVSRFSSSLGKVVWLPGKTHLVFQLGKEIHITERDGANDSVLATLNTDEPVNLTITNDGRYLIYQDGDMVYQRQIQ